MTKKKTSSASAPEPSPFPTQRELIVVTEAGAGVRSRGESVASALGEDVDPLNEILAANNALMVPLFGSEERVEAAVARSGLEAAEAGISPPSTYYRVYAADEKLDEMAEEFLALDSVDGAYVKPGAEPPVRMDAVEEPPAGGVAPPATADFTSNQTYLDAAPGGIDARYAWTVSGGKGQGVRIIDIEGAWRFTHEDLLQNQGGVIGGTQSTDIRWRNHGTAVVGVFGGDENGFGITGIAPAANTRAISIFGSGQGSAKAITDAANALSAGDIILIELHRPGPRHSFQSRDDQLGYIAVEWWPEDFAAIVFATSVRGVIVIEAGGNGAENLDDALYNTRPSGFPTSWSNPFNLANPQSGAVIVGAGAPPPGTHGRDHGPDRSRLGFSNFGARVDVQGWGREVTSTGYGGLQNGVNEDLWYTDTFSGTSSASPVVVGAVASMQGALKAASKSLLTPASARNILRTTGSPQQDAPGRPATQRIGNRPDLRAAFSKLNIVTKVLLKDLIKDKELHKDKIEIKENKVELKERIKDKTEFKDLIKDKEKEKEKEKDKEKEFKESSKDFKDIFEGRPQAPEGGQAAAGNLEARIAQLEQAMNQLVHFISGDLRPDLGSSALNQEEDLRKVSQELAKQANDAKQQKDDKDLEKLRET